MVIDSAIVPIADFSRSAYAPFDGTEESWTTIQSQVFKDIVHSDLFPFLQYSNLVGGACSRA